MDSVNSSMTTLYYAILLVARPIHIPCRLINSSVGMYISHEADERFWVLQIVPSTNPTSGRGTQTFVSRAQCKIRSVRKTGPRSNKIKQMQKQKHRRHTIQERHRFTWFTQCGLRPPEKLPGPSFIIIQQMKGYNLQQKPAVTSSSFSHSLLSQNTIFTLVHSRNTFPS
jgi:hypothetical protein